MNSFGKRRVNSRADGLRLTLALARRGIHQRQVSGEGGALPEHALDGQAAAVAVEDVLDQREPQAGAALRAALADVDAVEALGQPRQMLGRDAGTMVAHRD